MFKALKNIFNSGYLIKTLIKNVDISFFEDERKVASFYKLLELYTPFKLAQRVIAFSFTFIFIFILLNVTFGVLYDFIPHSRVEKTVDLLSKLWLGEIMLTIVSFYLSGGVVDSILNKLKK